MKIRNYIWIVLVLGVIGIPSAAQRRQSGTAVQGLTGPQRAAAVNTNLGSTCKEKPRKVPQVNAHDAEVFSNDRVLRTVNGVWRGSVRGNYDKKLLASDGKVNVDYYMIVDTKRSEVLVFEQFGSKRSAPPPKRGVPVWSYVFCDRPNYRPRHPPQVHEFHKVSDNIEDGRPILTASTGLTFEGSELVLANVWQKLVDTKFFDDPKRSLAYAGAFFKPVKIGNVPVAAGTGSLLEMDMQSEYRGSGQTAARFQPGVPLRGFERGKFLGVGTNAGDFLVSSFTLGEETTSAKEAESGGVISMQYDKIVIGPLAPGASASAGASKVTAVSAKRQK